MLYVGRENQMQKYMMGKNWLGQKGSKGLSRSQATVYISDIWLVIYNDFQQQKVE